MQLGTEVQLIDAAADNELGISCSNDAEPEICYIPVLSPSAMMLIKQWFKNIMISH